MQKSLPEDFCRCQVRAGKWSRRRYFNRASGKFCTTFRCHMVAGWPTQGSGTGWGGSTRHQRAARTRGTDSRRRGASGRYRPVPSTAVDAGTNAPPGATKATRGRNAPMRMGPQDSVAGTRAPGRHRGHPWAQRPPPADGSHRPNRGHECPRAPQRPPAGATPPCGWIT